MARTIEASKIYDIRFVRVGIAHGDTHLKEKTLLDIVTRWATPNFHELKIYYLFNMESKLTMNDLESFLIKWLNQLDSL